MSFWGGLILSLSLGVTAHASCDGRMTAHKIDQLKVAAVQYPARVGVHEDEFLSGIRLWVEKAKTEGAQLVVFPELVVLDMLQRGDAPAESAQLRTMARDFTPRYFTAIEKMAKDVDISILAGSAPRLVGNDVFNTAFLALADGQSYMQDKIYLTPDEVAWGWSRGSELKVVPTPWGSTAILICYDSEFPKLSELLAPAKPEVILVPSMTSDMSGLRRVQWSAQARAVEHYAYVVNTGTVPTARNTSNTAQASLLNPQEDGFPESIARGPMNDEAMVVGTLDIKMLRERRASAGIYPAREEDKWPNPQLKIIPEKGQPK